MTTPKNSPGKSKKKADLGSVEVKFTAPPKEFLYFNRYWIEKTGEFLHISLWFLDSFGASAPVFRGTILVSDFEQRKDGLKNYIERIGAGFSEEVQGMRPPLWTSPPVSFNFIDCIDRVKCSEIVIRKFSHKNVLEAAESGANMEGTTHGVYVCCGSIHRQFIVELINKSSKKQ